MRFAVFRAKTTVNDEIIKAKVLIAPGTSVSGNSTNVQDSACSPAMKYDAGTQQASPGENGSPLE